MAGPYPQGPAAYPPPGGYPMPQKKKGKGCLIAVIVVLVLGLGVVGGCVACGMWGVGQAQEQFEEAKGVTNDFMAKLSTGDIDGAYALCDSSYFTREQLDQLYHANESVLKGNTGVSYVEVVGLAGNVQVVNDVTTISFNPAPLNGHSEIEIRFVVEKKSGGAFKIIGFHIDGGTPTGDPGTAGGGNQQG